MKITVIVSSAVALLATVVLLSTHSKLKPGGPEIPAKSPPSAEERQTSSPSGILIQREKQISVKDKTREQAMQEWWQRRQQNKQADWKIGIRFYGKAVDQDMHPIPDANIEFEWTDLSARGTSKRTTTSDQQGLFSLDDVQGKNLGVYVSKDGYTTPKSSRARAFEFADPGERSYYEPNSRDPVIFYLQKKGEGARLVKKSTEVVLEGEGASTNVDLATGKVSPSGQLQVQAWKPWPPRPMSPHYDWKVVLRMSNGGFAEAPEEFAFEAPETVYNKSFEVNMPAAVGDAWKVSAEKTLYFVFGEPKKYGRLNFRTDGNSRYVFIEYVLNPSGSRNLEEQTASKWPDR